MTNQGENNDLLKNFALSEEEMMFKIEKERKIMVNGIDIILNKINRLGNKEMFDKSTTVLLNQIERYLVVDVKYINTKFSKEEFIFSKKINSLVNTETSILKKYLPFFVSTSEKTNKILINSINNLINEKKETIENYYKSDIQIVHSFLKYTTNKLKTREVFYYIPEYMGVSWTKKEFVKNLSNYFQYKLRLNPESLTENYINEIKGHYAFVGLGVDSAERTKLGNHYFETNNDSFDFGHNTIPSKYNDVKDIIRWVPLIMMKNEKDLQEIINYTVDEYNK